MFTSIQLNKNWRGDMHVDTMNAGSTLMFTCGGEPHAKSPGGDLLVLKPAGNGKILDKAKLLEVPSKNIMCEYERLETHNRWVQFDANYPHATFDYNTDCWMV
eukprot:g1859.t1